MKINVLGSEYEIIGSTVQEHPLLEDRNAYCDPSKKQIIYDQNTNELELEKDFYIKRILRHEIVHAFLFESGLDICCHMNEPWARNEEMVDWFAIQSPKIFDVYKKLDIL